MADRHSPYTGQSTITSTPLTESAHTAIHIWPKVLSKANSLNVQNTTGASTLLTGCLRDCRPARLCAHTQSKSTLSAFSSIFPVVLPEPRLLFIVCESSVMTMSPPILRSLYLSL